MITTLIFGDGYDPYSTSNITLTIQRNENLIYALENSFYLEHFNTFGNALQLNSDNSLYSLTAEIKSYISITKEYNTAVKNAMYLNGSSEEVSNNWDFLIDTYVDIKGKLDLLVNNFM